MISILFWGHPMKLARSAPTAVFRAWVNPAPREHSRGASSHSETPAPYSPAVFLRFDAGLGSDFFAIRIGTTSPPGTPQSPLAGSLGCLYV